MLHALLEPQHEEERVSFLGISNWALDASKMNRGISLCRPPNSKADLLETAQSIAEQLGHNPDTHLLGTYFSTLVDIYFSYTRGLREYAESEQIPVRNFHGLRDFYFTIKHICQSTAAALSRLEDATAS